MNRVVLCILLEFAQRTEPPVARAKRLRKRAARDPAAAAPQGAEGLAL